MTIVFDDATVRGKLTDAIALHGWRVMAEKAECDPSYLRQVANGKKPIGPAILRALDLRLVYAKK